MSIDALILRDAAGIPSSGPDDVTSFEDGTILTIPTEEGLTYIVTRFDHCTWDLLFLLITAVARVVLWWVYNREEQESEDKN